MKTLTPFNVGKELELSELINFVRGMKCNSIFQSKWDLLDLLKELDNGLEGFLQTEIFMTLPLLQEEKDMAIAGRIIDAIKSLRERTSCDLMVAKRRIDLFRSQGK